MLPKNKKRILILSTAYLPLVGGAEIAVKEITERLDDFEFELITARLKSNLPKIETIGKVRVHRLGFGCWFDKIILAVWGAQYALSLHQKENFDALWSVMASFSGLAAVKFKRRLDLPFLLTLQEGDNLSQVENKAKILGSWWKSIFTTADQVQVISSYLKDWAIRHQAKKVEIIPNGVATDIWHFRQDNNFQSKTLVTTSRLVAKNGVDLIIKSLPLLPEEISLHIAGVGREEVYLKQLTHNLGVEKRVVFYGFIEPEKLPAFLARFAVFIRPARSEGLGNSFLEAMAVGLPVVAPLVGGIKDFLVNRQTGFVIEPESPESVAKVVKYVLDENNQAEVSQVVTNARGMVEDKFNWDNIATRFRALFNQML
ncbi:MAG: hypothetical protein QG665_418 [Patescibacteria group bacterium]|nr:hypothetical protein [Patescibacteria group bacterium]